MAKVTRRIKVAASASGAGFSPFSSSFARMKRSASVRGHFESAEFFTAGTGGFTTGSQHQCSALRFWRSKTFFVATFAPASCGHGAPAFTQASMSAICCGGSAFFGGICMSEFFQRMASTSRLFSGSPGLMAGPVSPPLIHASRLSSISPPLSLSEVELWHL